RFGREEGSPEVLADVEVVDRVGRVVHVLGVRGCLAGHGTQPEAGAEPEGKDRSRQNPERLYHYAVPRSVEPCGHYCYPSSPGCGGSSRGAVRPKSATNWQLQPPVSLGKKILDTQPGPLLGFFWPSFEATTRSLWVEGQGEAWGSPGLARKGTEHEEQIVAPQLP